MRLEHPKAQAMLQQMMRFQFHKGAIRTVGFYLLISKEYNFNSIKVRLEHINDIYSTADTSFQFHKGAIRTKDDPEVFAAYTISIP